MLALLLACAGPADTPDDTGPVAPTASATLTPSADIPTVATLSWTLEAPARVFVRYGPYALETPLSDETTTGAAVLVGIPADTEAAWELVDDVGRVLATGAWTTGPLAAGLPTLTATGANDRWIFTPLLGGQHAAVLLAPDGAIVWWHFADAAYDTLRVLPSPDGSGVWFNVARVNAEPAEDSALVHVSWDGAVVTERAVPLLAHDFVAHPDGRLAALQARYDGDVRGNALVEVGADGTLTDAWTSWDCFDPVAHPGDTPALGWTFANSLDRTDTGYLVGLRNLSTVAWVENGTCTTLLGAAAPTVVPDDPFLHQHQFDLAADDTLVVFDNDGAGGAVSRVVAYTLDGAVARATWTYTADPPLYAFVLGDVDRLDDDDTFVTWSVAGRLERVAPDGTVRWRLDADLGAAFGFTTLTDGPLPR